MLIYPTGAHASVEMGLDVAMNKPPEDSRNAVPAQPHKTPPKPFTPKAKGRVGPPATKAEQAALKRADKTVIKRMRKR